VVTAPPSLAIPTRRGFSFAAPLQWWHLLSLDAPTVAALWAWSMARAVHVALPWSAPALLALGTWLIYITDRILDGLRMDGRGQLRERHLFYLKYRLRFVFAGLMGSVVLIWLVATRMTSAARFEDTALFAIATVYFFLIHLCGPKIERWFPKEIAVGVVFAAAVAVPAWSRAASHRASLVPVVAIFAAICWLNCVAIEKWEGAAGPRTPSNVTTRWGQSHLSFVSCGIALLAVVAGVAAIVPGHSVAAAVPYLTCALSAALFLLLDRSHLDAFRLRIAADAVLLTPLLFIAGIR
jgi:hypothetical protein